MVEGEVNVTLTFPNDELATAFMDWLCDAGGDQDFGMYNEIHGLPNVCMSFDFHAGNIAVTTSDEDEEYDEDTDADPMVSAVRW